jgi:rubrerythrin
MRKNWQNNREKKREPKQGKFWCPVCDMAVVYEGSRCPVCHKRIGKRNRK